MSDFKIGDLIVPNDKFYKTSSSTIGNKLGVFGSSVYELKRVFNNGSFPLCITNITKDSKGRVWLDVSWEGRYTAIDEYGIELDRYSYLAEYFKLYKEKKELGDLVLDYKLTDKLI